MSLRTYVRTYVGYYLMKCITYNKTIAITTSPIEVCAFLGCMSSRVLMWSNHINILKNIQLIIIYLQTNLNFSPHLSIIFIIRKRRNEQRRKYLTCIDKWRTIVISPLIALMMIRNTRCFKKETLVTWISNIPKH